MTAVRSETSPRMSEAPTDSPSERGVCAQDVSKPRAQLAVDWLEVVSPLMQPLAEGAGHQSYLRPGPGLSR